MEQKSDEWHKARSRRITASRCGAILGNSPWQSPDDVMRQMVRDALGAEREDGENIAMAYGNANEAGSVLDFQMDTGLDVEHVGFITLEDWAGCSPDGLTSDGGGLEIKNPFSLRKSPAPVPFKALSEQPHYRDQVQFSLAVTGRPHWHFYQSAPNGTKHEIEYPCKDWQADAMPRLRQFYARFLSELETPAEHLTPKRVVIDTPAASKAVREWDEIAEMAERLAERKADLLAQMVDMAGGRDATIAGRKLTLVEKAGAVSYKKALDHYAPKADTSAFMGKPSSFWKMT